MWEGKHDVDAYPPFRAYVEQDDRYLLEEEIQGRLMSLEGWSFDGEYHPIGITGRRVLRRDPAVEMGMDFPRRVPDQAAVEDYVARVHRALGVRHGPTHTELMLSDDGTVELVELNGRFVGADVLICMDLVFPRPVEEQLLELACGRPADPAAFRDPDGVAQLRYLLPPLEMEVFQSVCFGPGVRWHRVMKRPGDVVASNRNQVDWLAGFIVTGRDEQDALRQMEQVLAETTVNGRPLPADENLPIL